jgi:hypothetical protein
MESDNEMHKNLYPETIIVITLRISDITFLSAVSKGIVLTSHPQFSVHHPYFATEWHGSQIFRKKC